MSNKFTWLVELVDLDHKTMIVRYTNDANNSIRLNISLPEVGKIGRAHV